MKIFTPKGTLNDATEYYVQIIEKALSKVGIISERINTLKGVKKNDTILTLRGMDFVKAYIKKPTAKYLNWFQGIGPEEYNMMKGKSLIKPLLVFFETFTLKRAKLNFFVSNSMEKHYKEKYKIRIKDSIIMPCYNKKIQLSSFNVPNKYTTPSFVFAGSLLAWQCIDKTLEIFKRIEDVIPNAKLTLLTKDKEIAESLIIKYNVNNVMIKYVSLRDLDEELSRYKYGFLFREDHVVNNVATPTKMNSYMANGLIPIYTNVVHAFEENINLGKFSLKVNSKESNKEIADKIIEFNTMEINKGELYKQYSELFSNYYNDEIYSEIIRNKILSIIK